MESNAPLDPQSNAAAGLACPVDRRSNAFVAAVRAKESLVDLLAILDPSSSDRVTLLLALATCRAIAREREHKHAQEEA